MFRTLNSAQVGVTPIQAHYLRRLRVPEKIAPVGVCLHEAKLEHLLQAQFDQKAANLKRIRQMNILYC